MFHRPNTPGTPNSPATQPTTNQNSAPSPITAQPPVASPVATQTQPQQNQTQGEPEKMSQPTPPADAADNDARSAADIPATNPFQRPGAPAQPAQPALNPRVGGNYTAYPAYGGAPSPIGSAAAESNKRRLIIGEGITMSGEIESCDHLVVEGTVEAALKGANILEINEKGMFYGTVEINEATIAGKFEGEITVNGRLTIRGTGSVTGAITYKELAVEAGAVIDGKLSLLGGKGASSEKKSPRAAVAAKPQEELPILQRAAAQ